MGQVNNVLLASIDKTHTVPHRAKLEEYIPLIYRIGGVCPFFKTYILKSESL